MIIYSIVATIIEHLSKSADKTIRIETNLTLVLMELESVQAARTSPIHDFLRLGEPDTGKPKIGGGAGGEGGGPVYGTVNHYD